jgi:hypothetical protein
MTRMTRMPGPWVRKAKPGGTGFWDRRKQDGRLKINWLKTCLSSVIFVYSEQESGNSVQHEGKFFGDNKK